MTGAGVVQSASAIGFETLYAGYRWDNPAPQMYNVRNRFLLPQVGTWNKRDPVTLNIDVTDLYEISDSAPTWKTDPIGEAAVQQLRIPRIPSNPQRTAPQVRGLPMRSPGRLPTGPTRTSPIRTVRNVRMPKPIRTPSESIEQMPWGFPSNAPTIGEPRIPMIAKQPVGAVISNPDTCWEPAPATSLTPPAEIINIRNDPRSRDCKRSFGFADCEPNRTVQEVLMQWLRTLVSDINLASSLVITDCRVATPDTFLSRPGQFSYCSPHTPSFNVHCKVAVATSAILGYVQVNSPEISTSCCLCCSGKAMGIHCGDAHAQTKPGVPRSSTTSEFLSALDGAFERAGLL
jgi:hypothetical protein